MSCENKDKYSIHEICNSIKNQELILPDIQRKFVWDERKIICLFDSIMRGYPINTLMFWKLDTRDVTYAETIGKTKFYKFLDNYTKDADNENDQVKTPSGKFDAVIDGQQRLTCLYLGFYGTISGEKRLCVSLEKKETSEDDEDGLRYDFQFRDVEDDNLEIVDGKWFVLNKIHSTRFYSAGKDKKNDREIREHLRDIHFSGLGDGKKEDDAIDIILRMRTVYWEKDLISAYIIADSNMDEVFDIFIRANSGGKPLTYSELLLAATTNKWSFSDKDARKAFSELREDVKEISQTHPFKVSNDFILNCCLMVFAKDVKARVSNFTDDVVHAICDNWEKLSDCITSAFRLIYDFFGIDGYGLRSLNSVVPIVYYIYLHNLEGTIARPELRKTDNVEHINNTRDNIRIWFTASLLKGVFGGQSIGLLTKLKRIIRDSKTDFFPTKEIFDEFAGTSKSLYFEDDTQIEKILRTQYEDQQSSTILAFLYPQIVAIPHRGIAKDHIHPKKFFCLALLSTICL